MECKECCKPCEDKIILKNYIGVILDDSNIVGSHVSFKNSCFHDSIQYGIDLGMYAIQVYMGSQQCYSRSQITENDIQKTLSLLKYYPTKIFTHSPVIYNLAGSVKNKSLAWCGSSEVDNMMINLVRNLNYELSILDKIGAVGTVIHPGSCVKVAGKTQEQLEEDAITSIAKTLDHVVFNGKAKVLLENCAGESGKVAYNIDQLVKIREKVCEKNKKNIAFCIDTAHVFGAGLYNLSKVEEVKKMFKDIDKCGCVELIHLNDSVVPFRSKKDRHALLRTGYIWGEDDTSLKLLLEEARVRKIPCILETSPSDMYSLFDILGKIF